MRDTRVLLERQQTIGALQDFTAELQPVLRQVGDLERILARLALRTARPRDLARMRHAFQQLPELRALLENVDSAPVQALREKNGRVCRAARSAGASNHRHTASAGTRRWCYRTGL
ncbi:DNA mismatch repair protein MutS [Escherichia coli]|uniref:DNA mismatch repair protein MutS n=1 Tax=Escherichia coli TaxID=562 RepID=A0A376LBD1_ECOLX|nr:DNA mismatch repair protein MutS [Escherichia coli]